MQYRGINQEYFEVNTVNSNNCYVLKEAKKSELSLLWFDSDDNQIIIDSILYHFNRNDFVFLTEFHQVEIIKVYQVKLLRFNRPFYCVLDHDSEIGCKGILYYGAANLPIARPNHDDLEILETVWKMLRIEMVSKDNLQLEMLQMMLKRILILCTRVYKKQLNYDVLERNKTDIIREFNFLVEKHFREKHRVGDYAKLLNKTPKSLANLFKKVGTKTPSQFIQERIILEARRLLKHSNKTISDIGYELGFIDVQAFSRFFKNREGIYPTDFRNLD